MAAHRPSGGAGISGGGARPSGGARISSGAPRIQSGGPSQGSRLVPGGAAPRIQSGGSGVAGRVNSNSGAERLVEHVSMGQRVSAVAGGSTADALTQARRWRSGGRRPEWARWRRQCTR